jgi:hypothetical protein
VLAKETWDPDSLALWFEKLTESYVVSLASSEVNSPKEHDPWDFLFF